MEWLRRVDWRHRGAVLAAALSLALLLSGCSLFGDDAGGSTDPEQVNSERIPTVGACRVLTPDDVEQPANATETVKCTEAHTAQTFAVGTLPPKFAEAAWDSKELGRHTFKVCSNKFQEFLGADESLVMRTRLNWAWFRPSESAWKSGARWYRCDVVGGSREFSELPTTAKNMLNTPDPDDTWMVCADGDTVAEGEKVPCSEPHTWRAITTIKLGQPGDPYPGDAVARSRTKEYCSDSVGAKLNYPLDFEYGFSWYGKADWEAGNRRSVCWAKTKQ